MTIGSRDVDVHRRESVRPAPEYIRPQEAALYIGISTSTLAKLRMRANRDRGPRFVKLSGCVIYRRSDLDAWVLQNLVAAAK